MSVCILFNIKVKTCPAAMGYSFAAGTTDGPGDFDFTQGTNSTNKFWAFVSQFISKPTPEQVKCQAPKPILLNTGEVSRYHYTADGEKRTVCGFIVSIMKYKF